MSKHINDFNSALRKVVNGPKSRIGKRLGKDTRDRGSDFVHFVKKFPGQAANSEKALDHAAHLAQNGDAESVLEAIEYLLDSEARILTHNKHFGFILEALANNGKQDRIKEIFEQSVQEWAQNMAANASTGAAIDSLISNEHGLVAAKLFLNLAYKAPEILASNPVTGWIIDHLIQNGHYSEAVNSFFVIATKHPVTFSKNKTVGKAITAVKGLDLKELFGHDKGELVGPLIDELHKHQQTSPAPRFD